MKKLLLTAFAIAVTFVSQMAPSFAACNCGKMYVYSPAHVTGFAAPCATPCVTPCVTPCNKAIVTGYAAPCLTETCGCPVEPKCCCKRSFWDKLFHRNKCCEPKCDCCEPKCDCCDPCDKCK